MKKMKKTQTKPTIENKSNVVGAGFHPCPKQKNINKHTSNVQTSNIKSLTSNVAITLIALIITIIVLLILAGVTLNMVMGDSGIFSKANTAKEQTQLSTAEETIRLAVLENKAKEKSGETALNDAELKAEIAGKLKELGYTVAEDNNVVTYYGEKTINIEDYFETSEDEEESITIADGDNTQGDADKTIDGKTATYRNPIIPAGFKAVDSTIDNTINANASWTNGEGYKYGLVIQDKEGNQFVWIAVDGTNVALNRYQFQDSLNANNESYTKYSETLDSTWAQKVATYGGYYIGRYETQYASNKCVVKKGNVPTVNVTKGTAQGYAQGMDTTYEYTTVTTDLLNSYMWDTALKYIDYYAESSFSTTTGLGNAGRINSGAVASGSYSNDIKCNIADMSGNVREWTTEYYSSSYPCVDHGGNYGSRDAACRRNYSGTSNSYSYIGFRCALYW